MPEDPIAKNLRRQFDSTVEQRVERLKALDYKRIIGGHFFAAASTECLELYRDGYMIGTIMCAQALIQAILRFAADSNGLPSKLRTEEQIQKLEEASVISSISAQCSKEAWTHRNDFHHLNPGVASIDLGPKAAVCVQAVTSLESDIFDFETIQGKIKPKYTIYWDENPDGTVPAYIRNLDA